MATEAREIEQEIETSTEDGYQEIPTSEIVPNRHQPRKFFDDEAHQELTESVREHGVLEPILVRPLNDDFDEDAAYELIAGERRWTAAREAELETIPAIVKDMQDQEAAEVALLENFQREDLSPIEEANALAELKTFPEHETQEDLAETIGCSPGKVSQRMKLLELPDPVKDRVMEGDLSATDARELLRYKDLPEDILEHLAEKIICEDVSSREIHDAAGEFFNDDDRMKPVTGRQLHHSKRCLFDPRSRYQEDEDEENLLGTIQTVETPAPYYIDDKVVWTWDLEEWDLLQDRYLREALEVGEIPDYAAGQALNAMEDPSEELEELVEDYKDTEDEDVDADVEDRIQDAIDDLHDSYSKCLKDSYIELINEERLSVSIWLLLVAAGERVGRTSNRFPDYYQEVLDDVGAETPIIEDENFPEIVEDVTSEIRKSIGMQDILFDTLKFSSPPMDITHWAEECTHVLYANTNDNDLLTVHNHALEQMSELWEDTLLESHDLEDEDVSSDPLQVPGAIPEPDADNIRQELLNH